MGVVRERLADMARRAKDLSALSAPIRQVLWEGNKQRALDGTDAQGRAFEPLAPSTLKRRDGGGPPLAPRGEASGIVTGFVVDVLAGPGRLSITGSWPDLPWVIYHARGGRHLPVRDPFGWREQDLAKVRALVRNHIRKGR